MQAPRASTVRDPGYEFDRVEGARTGLYRAPQHVYGQGRSRVLLRRLAVRYAIAAPIFVFAAWLFVTGALGPSS